MQSEGNAKFRVNFKPTEAQTHLISVKFNNEPVPSSPFECSVRATSTTNGSVSFDGGIGVVKNAVIGGDLIVSGGNSKLGNIRIENKTL